jgi:hypothetical protein
MWAQGLYVCGTLLCSSPNRQHSVVWATGDGIWSSYEGAHLIWRAASAVADLLTILLVFLIGVRLHDKWVGVLAAGLYACAPFAIQQSHFGTVDAMATTFVLLALYFAVRVQDKGTAGYALWLALAAAVASRVSLRRWRLSSWRRGPAFAALDSASLRGTAAARMVSCRQVVSLRHCCSGNVRIFTPTPFWNRASSASRRTALVL